MKKLLSIFFIAFSFIATGQTGKHLRIVVNGISGGGGSGVTSLTQGYGILNSINPITTTGTQRVDTFAISTRAWRDKLADSLGAIITTKGIGTVTSVATNNLTGLFGGTITGSGTLYIDTTIISTRGWRDKLADSLGLLIAGKQTSLSGIGLLSFSGTAPSYNTTSSQIASIISDETGTDKLVFNTTPAFITNITTPLVLGGSTTTSPLTFKTTSGVGTTGAEMHFQVGNNGSLEAMTILNTGHIGISSTTPGVALTIGNSLGGNIRQYNTSDQITNTESFSLGYVSNVYNISSTNTGSGTTSRPIRMLVSAGGQIDINLTGGAAGFVQLGRPAGSSGNNSSFVAIAGGNSLTHSTGTGRGLAIIPTVNQSSTAGYSALWISPFQSAVGSGTKLLIDAGTNSAASGGGTHTSLFSVNNTGKIGMSSTITAAGTTGAQTIDKPAGSVNFIATGQTLVVTNSTVTTSSIISLTVATDDITANSAVISAQSAGSFTIKLNAAATNETKVTFVIIN